jgi:hypothetical protein
MGWQAGRQMDGWRKMDRQTAGRPRSVDGEKDGQTDGRPATLSASSTGRGQRDGQGRTAGRRRRQAACRKQLAPAELPRRLALLRNSAGRGLLRRRRPRCRRPRLRLRPAAGPPRLLRALGAVRLLAPLPGARRAGGRRCACLSVRGHERRRVGLGHALQQRHAERRYQALGVLAQHRVPLVLDRAVGPARAGAGHAQRWRFRGLQLHAMSPVAAAERERFGASARRHRARGAHGSAVPKQKGRGARAGTLGQLADLSVALEAGPGIGRGPRTFLGKGATAWHTCQGGGSQ